MLLRFPFARSLLLGGALLLCAAPAARAAWPNSPLVNVPVCAAAGDQWNPVTVSDGDGGVVIAWYDWRSGNADVYVQRLSSTGVARWRTGGVRICRATGDQVNVKLCADGSGGAVVVWQDGRGSTLDIYAQHVNASGEPEWTADGEAVCAVVYDQANPAIVTDGAGGAIIAWQDRRSGTEYDIYAQHLTSKGEAVWRTDGVVVCQASHDQQYPVLVPEASGAIVAWQDYRSNAHFDVYAQRLHATGEPMWLDDGVALCTATGNQTGVTIATDGAGGAVVAWMDERGASRDIYARRVLSTGEPDWTPNGVAVCTATGDQWNPVIRWDGSSGAILAWFDWRSGNADLYAQHLDGTGAELWAWWVGNGKMICDLPNDQTNVVIAPDDAGGTYIAWQDARSNLGTDIYAGCLDSNGWFRWAGYGVALCTALGDQTVPAMIADGAGNAIVAWMDRRGASRDIYAQRVDKWGALGGQPAIVRVKDVPNDQGGKVSIYWTASPYDSFPNNYVGEYRIYSRNHGSTAWLLEATQTAQCASGYSHVVNTPVDSTAGSNPYTTFKIQAYSWSMGGTWDSDPDSGYSVDNLSPPTPAPFSGTYTAGTATLEWGASTAPDLAGYRLYRGVTPDFAPQAGDLVVAQTGTGYVDAAGAPYYYRLAAVDLHGNESAYATLLPAGAVDAPGAWLPRELALSAPAPNPLRGTTTMRLALPRAAPVSLALFDQQGRRIRTLAEGVLPAGERTVVWDGRDEGGRAVASGLYFLRLQAEGRVIGRRLAVVR